MGLHKFKSQAIRFNGFTDGIVVPTGQYKESGVNLLRPTYAGGSATTKSQATKIGRIHLPTENNPLNRIMGPFTIEAFLVPNYGGTVVSKPGCFELKVGDPFKNAPITFSINTIGRVFTVSTTFNVNVLYEANSGTYSGGEHKPSDITEGAQPLMLVTAQFLGDAMKIFVNASLVASLNLVESRILDNVSSDLFIGGKGGEFRGLIESVRVQNGEQTPVTEPFFVTDETIGFWDFNDELDIPNLHFFNNRNESSPNQGRDGTPDHPDTIDTPLVMLGYDFKNINDYGYFRIYERPAHPTAGITDTYTALERLAAYATGIELDKVKEQSWYGTSLTLNASTYGSTTGSLDYLSGDRVKQSSLNAVINQSGTHPLTGLAQTATGRLLNLTTGGELGIATENDLDPMVNPIERVRIQTLDFLNNRVICQSVHLTNDTTTGATIENHPKGQGLLFDHADGTPIWLTLGNGDLVIDPGNTSTSSLVANQVTRQKDAFTRASFTQGQRFNDRSGKGNTAYFTSIQSRITTGTAAPTSNVPDPDPPKDDLLMWCPANGIEGLTDGDPITIVPDQSGNKFNLYPIGTWVYEAASSSFNSKPGIKVTSSDGALMNTDTNDGETAKLAHAAASSFTAFWYYDGRTVLSTTYVTDFIGQNANNPKTFFGSSSSGSAFSLTNNGVTTAQGGATYGINQVGLLSCTFDAATTNATIHVHSATDTTFVAKITGEILFGDRLFTLFGRGASFDGASKVGTATNKAKTNFRFAEFLLYDKAMTDYERGQVNGYFLNKYTVI